MKKLYAKVAVTGVLLMGTLVAMAVEKRDYFRADKGVPAVVTTGVTTDKVAKKSSMRPSRVTAGGTDLYGYVYDWDKKKNYDYGLYEFQADGSYKLKWADPRKELNQLVVSGYYLDGYVYGYAESLPDETGLPLSSNYFVQIDMQTGKTVKSTRVDLDWTVGYPVSPLAYNPEDGYFYFFGFKNNGNSFIRATPENPGNMECVKSLSGDLQKELMYSFAYCPEDKAFYGMNLNGQFCRINTAGEQTVIANVPDKSDQATYQAGLAWAPNERVFYWNSISSSNESRIYTVTREGDFNLEGVSKDNVCLNYMFTPEHKTILAAPETPEIESISFENGSTSGTLTFTMPSKLQNGNAISSAYSYSLTVDGQVHVTETAQPGSKVKGEFRGLSTGKHLLGVYCTYEGQSCEPATRLVYVGYDKPLAPADVKMTASKISWTAPKTGENGGYVDAAALTYNVKVTDRSGREVFSTTTSSTSTDYNIPTSNLSVYTAYVTAVNHGQESVAGSSEGRVAGDYLRLPAEFAPIEEDMALMTIVDRNNDKMSWDFLIDENNPLKSNTFYSGYGEGTAMDDYLFLPAMYFDSADVLYQFAMDASRWSPRNSKEYLEVVLATEPTYDGVLQTVIEKKQINCAFDLRGNQTSDFDRLTASFKVLRPGTYYIGIHCVSDVGQDGVIVRNIRVSDDNVAPTSPKAPTQVSARAGANGALEATVTVTLPKLDMSDNAIAADETLTAHVSCESDVAVTGKPGDRVQATVKTLQGLNHVKVVVTNSRGENSPEAGTDVFTGENIPDYVQNIRGELSDDNATLKISWDAPTQGADGGYINPANITYIVYQRDPSAYEDAQWVFLENVGSATSYTFAPDMQDNYTLAVAAVNVAGRGNLSYATSVVGPTFDIPMEETFGKYSGRPDLTPWIIHAGSYSAEWSILSLSQADNIFAGKSGHAMMATGTAGNTGRVGAPRFNTKKSAHAALKISSYAGSRAAETKVYGYSTNHTDRLYEICTLPWGTSSNEIVTGTYELPAELLGEGWVQILIQPTFRKSNEMFVMTSFKVEASNSVNGLNGDNAEVVAGNGEIAVNGAEGLAVAVISADGKVMSNVVAKASERFSVPSGIYVVRVNGESYKVIVK